MITDGFCVEIWLLEPQAAFTKYPCFLCEWDDNENKNH